MQGPTIRSGQCRFARLGTGLADVEHGLSCDVFTAKILNIFFRSMQLLVLIVAVTYKHFQLTSDSLAVSISGERSSQFSVSIFLINGPISSYILDHYGSQLSVCGAYIAC